MSNFFDLSTVAKRFRFISVIEAFTWALLLIGMLFKYGFGMESAVSVPGMLHGIAFIVYLMLGGLAALEFKWSLKTVALAVVASIVPFATVPFEKWVARNGQLGELSEAQADAA